MKDKLKKNKICKNITFSFVLPANIHIAEKKHHSAKSEAYVNFMQSFAINTVRLERMYIWRGCTSGEDVHLERMYIWRGWRGCTSGEDVHLERMYIWRMYIWRAVTNVD